MCVLLCSEGDETQKQRQERQMEKTRKRALSSSIMHDLRQEYDDGPEEVRVSIRGQSGERGSQGQCMGAV